MQDHLAAETLERLQGVRNAARSDLQAFWFPLVVFGGLTLVSAAVVVLVGPDALGAYWPVAGPVGGCLTGWYYYRRGHRMGLEGPAAPYVVTAVAILVGAMLAGALGSQWGSGMTAAVGPTMVVAAGYFVFAWLERSTILVALAAVLCFLALGVTISGMEAEAGTVVLALASGTASLGIGLASALRAG
ncbi:MAG: hypothetical protein M3396_05060 [Actinomycetota bacterium]|nr:hypothetical protein [Actinomycetota bacterium]MDQ3575213.1 hypothetical protein [Actinomycetota bacterium]